MTDQLVKLVDRLEGESCSTLAFIKEMNSDTKSGFNLRKINIAKGTEEAFEMFIKSDTGNACGCGLHGSVESV